MTSDGWDQTRRRFLGILIAAPFALATGRALAGPGSSGAAKPSGAAARAKFAPTPECGDDDEPTPPETEGPFFKPRSPLRTSLLEPGVRGRKIELEGRVYSRHCRPLAGVLMDFWHADDS